MVKKNDGIQIESWSEKKKEKRKKKEHIEFDRAHKSIKLNPFCSLKYDILLIVLLQFAIAKANRL